MFRRSETPTVMGHSLGNKLRGMKATESAGICLFFDQRAWSGRLRGSVEQVGQTSRAGLWRRTPFPHRRIASIRAMAVSVADDDVVELGVMRHIGDCVPQSAFDDVSLSVCDYEGGIRARRAKGGMNLQSGRLAHLLSAPPVDFRITSWPRYAALRPAPVRCHRAVEYLAYSENSPQVGVESFDADEVVVAARYFRALLAGGVRDRHPAKDRESLLH